MVEEARRHAAEDQRRKELVETRNQADSLAYQMEKTLRELGDKVSASDRQAIEAKIAEVRRVKDSDDINRIRQAMEELKQASYAMSQQMYGQPQYQYGRPGGNGSEPRQGYGEGEDVVEGEFHAV